MNKQEAIETLKSEARHHCGEKECYKDGCTKNVELDIVIDIVNQLDEPAKPVLTKEEAEWVEGLKEEQERRPFWTKYSMLYFITRCGFGYGFSYDHKGREIELKHYPHEIHVEKERLANAILYGYEVEKEKLYTARFKHSNEYLNFDKDYGGLHWVRVPKDILESCSGYQFKKETLIKYSLWNNPAFEIEEVEE